MGSETAGGLVFLVGCHATVMTLPMTASKSGSYIPPIGKSRRLSDSVAIDACKGYLNYPKGTLGLFTNRKKSLQMQYRNDEL
jgi:hypothetical protein